MACLTKHILRVQKLADQDWIETQKLIGDMDAQIVPERHKAKRLWHDGVPQLKPKSMWSKEEQATITHLNIPDLIEYAVRAGKNPDDVRGMSIEDLRLVLNGHERAEIDRENRNQLSVRTRITEERSTANGDASAKIGGVNSAFVAMGVELFLSGAARGYAHAAEIIVTDNGWSERKSWRPNCGRIMAASENAALEVVSKGIPKVLNSK